MPEDDTSNHQQRPLTPAAPTADCRSSGPSDLKSCGSSCSSSVSSGSGLQSLFKYEAKRAGGVYEQMMRILRAGNNSNTLGSIRDVQVHTSQSGKSTRVETELQPTGTTADLNINIIMDSDSNLSNAIGHPSIEYESLDQTGASDDGRTSTTMGVTEDTGAGSAGSSEGRNQAGTDSGGAISSGRYDANAGFGGSAEGGPGGGGGGGFGSSVGGSSFRTSEDDPQPSSSLPSSKDDEGGGYGGGQGGGSQGGGGQGGGGQGGGGQGGGRGSGGRGGGVSGGGGGPGGGGHGGPSGGGHGGANFDQDGLGGASGLGAYEFESYSGSGPTGSADVSGQSPSNETTPPSGRTVDPEDDDSDEDEEGGEGEEGDLDDAQRHFQRYLDGEKVDALRGPGKEGEEVKETKKKLPVGHLEKEGVVIGCISVFADVHLKEYIVFLSDEMIQAFLVDPGRFRSVANRTKCEIEVTRRILNRRMGRYRWLKYLIVVIRGPSYSAIDQCDKMMIMLFPPFKSRKPYGIPAMVSLFFKETTPDNTDLYFNFQRTGPSQRMFGEIPLRAPFRRNKSRPLETTPWKAVVKRQQWGVLEPKNDRMETVMSHVYPERGGTLTGALDHSIKWADAAEMAVTMAKAKDVARAQMLKARKMDSEPLYAKVFGEG